MQAALTTLAQPDQATRILALQSGLRWLRLEAGLNHAGDMVHSLLNSVATIQGALALVEGRRLRGQVEDVEEILALAESRLRQARVMILHARQARFAGQQYTLAAA
jgi:hypothetical protein